MEIQGEVGFNGALSADIARRPSRIHTLARTPFGRLMWSRDLGSADMIDAFASHLFAEHRDSQGRLIEHRDLGSGKVTNIGVLALANDFAWSTAMQTFRSLNWIATGIGATAEAATDMALQTASAPTNVNAVSGAQSLVSAANSQQFRQTATVNYGSSLAITEWGLFSAQPLSATTGTPFTGTSATTGTATGTPYTASSGSVQGEQLLAVFPGVTAVWGLILSNTTGVLTIPAWYKVSDGTAGSTPGATEAFSIKPVMFDHKVFAALNVNSGDTITFIYTLTINSGG